MLQKDRLVRTMKVLQAQSHPVGLEALAEAVGVPAHVLSDDLRVLMRRKFPVEGDQEKGFQVVRERVALGLHLTEDELEAALMGAVWAADNGDPSVAAAARSLLVKLSKQMPPELRPVIMDSGAAPAKLPVFDSGMLRQALRGRNIVRMRYRDNKGKVTTRLIWPLVMAHAEEVRVLVAWCELRDGFRHFSVSQIEAIDVLDARYPIRREKLMADWRAYQEKTGNKANI